MSGVSRSAPLRQGPRGTGASARGSNSRLQVDAELAQVEDRGVAPAGGVGGEGEHERDPVRFPHRLAVAQDLVVAGCRLDGEAGYLEPADELADVLPHLRLVSGPGCGSD